MAHASVNDPGFMVVFCIVLMTFACLCFHLPSSDFLILPGFIDFTSDEVVSVIILTDTICCTRLNMTNSQAVTGFVVVVLSIILWMCLLLNIA